MMRSCPNLNRIVAVFMAFSFFLVSGVVAPAQAALIGTADILSSQQDMLARQKVVQFMAREDVARHLQAWGVDAEEAMARVNAMSPEEVRLLADKIDQLPAGGDALGFVIGVAFIVFVVLIVTDIIGITDVFTFIKKR